MNAIAFVLMNKESAELFLAYPMYFRFPDDDITSEHFKVGLFFESDTPCAYCIEYANERMTVNKDLFDKKLKQKVVEVLGTL
jgi:hypothetical protein